MARPFRFAPGGIWYLRQRTPIDVLAKAKGQTVSLPIKDDFVRVTIGELVQVSLRTRDDREARERHAVADAALRRFWEAQRAGAVRLTRKQTLALAGEFYRLTVAQAEDDPGEPEAWLGSETRALIARVSRKVPLSQSLSILPDGEPQGARLESLYGEAVNDLLSRDGLVINPESRASLLVEVGRAFEQAARQLRSNAEGDYRPDPDAARFPEMIRVAPAEPIPAGALTIAQLHARWETFQADKLAPNTLKRYRASLGSLVSFLGTRNVRSLSGDDIFAWAVHRRDTDGINPRGINKNDLVAASSVFKWAMDREGGKLLTENPAAGISLSAPARKLTRLPTFRSDEIKSILRAASEVVPSTSNPTAGYATRWCPWLSAYTAARITELTRLRGSDIRLEDGIAVIDLTKTKTGVPRSVPIHEHLIELGFLEFAKGMGTKPLFYDPARSDPGSKTDPAEIRSRKMAQWVRDAVNLDPEVQPDHAWRHTWKTRALEAGIPERTSDAIAGHKPKGVARGYEHPSLRAVGEAMKRFPRYDLS